MFVAAYSKYCKAGWQPRKDYHIQDRKDPYTKATEKTRLLMLQSVWLSVVIRSRLLDRINVLMAN